MYYCAVRQCSCFILQRVLDVWKHWISSHSLQLMLSQAITGEALFWYTTGPISNISCLECDKRPPAHIYLDKHAKDDVILCGKVGDRSLTNPTPTAGTVQHLTVACLCVGAWNVRLNLMEPESTQTCCLTARVAFGLRIKMISEKCC